MRRLISVSGKITDLEDKITWDQMREKILGNKESLVEMVMLNRWPSGVPPQKEKHVMFVDEEGATEWHPGYPLPVNVEATKYYLANCVPGTTWKIRGTAYICPFDDYE